MIYRYSQAGRKNILCGPVWKVLKTLLDHVQNVYTTVYLIVLNNISSSNTTDQLTDLLGPSNKLHILGSRRHPHLQCLYHRLLRHYDIVLSPPPPPSSDSHSPYVIDLFSRGGDDNDGRIILWRFLAAEAFVVCWVERPIRMNPCELVSRASARVRVSYITHTSINTVGISQEVSIHVAIGENRIFVCVCAVRRVQQTHTHTHLSRSINRLVPCAFGFAY